VFDLLTSPAGQRAFYGNDAPGWVVDSRCDLRVGGTWEIVFGPSTDVLYRHRHVFEAIERPSRQRDPDHDGSVELPVRGGAR
jgi:uncharacterized protein YndB with AHSA1/START domain